MANASGKADAWRSNNWSTHICCLRSLQRCWSDPYMRLRFFGGDPRESPYLADFRCDWNCFSQSFVTGSVPDSYQLDGDFLVLLVDFQCHLATTSTRAAAHVILRRWRKPA